MVKTVAQRIAILESIRDTLLDNMDHAATRKKTTYRVNGQSFSWTEAIKQWRAQYNEVQEEIDRLNGEVGPFEIHSQGVT